MSFEKVGLQTVSMPLAGLGTWTANQTTDSAEVEASIEAALEAGVRMIDTATAYGNEAAIGLVLKKWLDAGKFIIHRVDFDSLFQCKFNINMIKQSCTIFW
jgi:diketogulonate reductase-like aldo/keto reductase